MRPHACYSLSAPAVLHAVVNVIQTRGSPRLFTKWEFQGYGVTRGVADPVIISRRRLAENSRCNAPWPLPPIADTAPAERWPRPRVAPCEPYNRSSNVAMPVVRQPRLRFAAP